MRTFWASSPLALASFFWLTKEWSEQDLPLRNIEVAVTDPARFAEVGNKEAAGTENSARLGLAQRIKLLRRDRLIDGCWYRCASCYREIAAYKRGRAFPCKGCGSADRVLTVRLNPAAVEELLGTHKMRSRVHPQQVAPPPELFPTVIPGITVPEKSAYERMVTGANIPPQEQLPPGWRRNDDGWPVNPQEQVCDPRTLQPIPPALVPQTVGVPASPASLAEVQPIHMMAADPQGIERERAVGNLEALAATGAPGGLSIPLPQQLSTPPWVGKLDDARTLVAGAMETGRPWLELGGSLGLSTDGSGIISTNIYGPSWPHDSKYVPGVTEAVVQCSMGWLGGNYSDKKLAALPGSLKKSRPLNPYEQTGFWAPMSSYVAQQEALWGFRLPVELPYIYSWFNTKLSPSEEVLVYWDWMMQAMTMAGRPLTVDAEQEWLDLPAARWVHERLRETTSIETDNYPHVIVLGMVKALANAVTIHDIGRILRGDKPIYDSYD